MVSLWLVATVAMAQPPEAHLDRGGLVIAGDAGAAVRFKYGGRPFIGQTGVEVGTRSERSHLELRGRVAGLFSGGRADRDSTCTEPRRVAGPECVDEIPSPVADITSVLSVDTAISRRWNAGLSLGLGARVMRHVFTGDALGLRPTLVAHPHIRGSILLTRSISEHVDYRFYADIGRISRGSARVDAQRYFYRYKGFVGLRFGAAWFPRKADI